MRRKRRLLKRHQAGEPIIGHLKADHGLRRNWLKGQAGDALQHNPVRGGLSTCVGCCGAIFRLGIRRFYARFCYDQALIGRPARLLGGSGTDTIDHARMMTHLAAFVELTNLVFKNSEIKAAFTLVDAMPMNGEDIRLASVLGKSDENGHYPRELTRMGRQIQVALEEKNADVAVLYGDDGTGGKQARFPILPTREEMSPYPTAFYT